MHLTEKNLCHRSCAAHDEEPTNSLFWVDMTNSFLVMAENILTFDLWVAFRPEVEFHNKAYGRKALYWLHILVFG